MYMKISHIKFEEIQNRIEAIENWHNSNLAKSFEMKKKNIYIYGRENIIRNQQKKKKKRNKKISKPN